jgi:hypothetical protein
MKTLNRTKRPDAAALKERYLECIGLTSVSTTALEGVVERLLGLGISRKTLVDWAVRKGYSRGSAANLLTRIFKALGLRERQPGAGRKPSRETLELLGYARARYGNRCLKVLRAAWRTGKAQAKSGSGNFAPQSDVAEKPPVARPLRRIGANNGSIIRRNGHGTRRNSSGIRPSAAVILKRNGNAIKAIKKPNSQHTNMNLGANNGSIIRRNGHETQRDSLGIHPSAAVISKGNGNVTKKSRNQTNRIQL